MDPAVVSKNLSSASLHESQTKFECLAPDVTDTSDGSGVELFGVDVDGAWTGVDVGIGLGYGLNEYTGLRLSNIDWCSLALR